MDSKVFCDKLINGKGEELIKFFFNLTEAEKEAQKVSQAVSASLDSVQEAQDKLEEQECTPGELESSLKSYQINCARLREKIIDIERQLTKGLELVQTVINEHQPPIKKTEEVIK